ARLTSARASRPDEWLAWARALWYGAAVCVAVTLLVGVWSFASASTPDPDAALSFSQDLEQTIFDSVDEGDANWCARPKSSWWPWPPSCSLPQALLPADCWSARPRRLRLLRRRWLCSQAASMPCGGAPNPWAI